MKYLLVPLLALTLPLTACVVPPSKAYDASQQANVAILDDGALNIDIIKPVSFKVDSKKTWQNTGRFMENGDMVNITANGSWSPAAAMNVWSGPEGNILGRGDFTDLVDHALAHFEMVTDQPGRQAAVTGVGVVLVRHDLQLALLFRAGSATVVAVDLGLDFALVVEQVAE